METWITNGINSPSVGADPNCPYCHGQGFTMVTADFQNNGYPYAKPMGCGCRSKDAPTITLSATVTPKRGWRSAFRGSGARD